MGEKEVCVEGKRKKRPRREALREERVSSRVMWLVGSGGGGLRTLNLVALGVLGPAEEGIPESKDTSPRSGC